MILTPCVYEVSFFVCLFVLLIFNSFVVFTASLVGMSEDAQKGLHSLV